MKDFAKAQAEACCETVRFMLKAVLTENRAADKSIAYFFKTNKQYGSRDRKIIYDMVFAVFRYFGWVNKIIKSKNEYNSLTNLEIGRMLILSALLDNIDLSICERLFPYFDNKINLNNLFSQKPTTAIPELFKKYGLDDEFSVFELLPSWIEKKLKKYENFDLEKFIEFVQKRPPIWIRLQSEESQKILNEFQVNNIKFSVDDRIKNAVAIKEAPVSLYTLNTFKDGLFEIQDIGSQVIGIVSGAKSAQRWWDCCAGAGGKSLQLSCLMENKGRVVASDIRNYKLDDLKVRARRAGRFNIECKEWEGKELRKNKQDSFDGVFIDAPCSCSGTWRRNPDAKWRLSEKDLEELSEIQSNILDNVVSSVKKGGVCIYATCSIFEEENEIQVDTFLQRHPEFKLEPFTDPLTGNQTNGILKVFPWIANSDSMFVAKFIKS